MRQGRGLALHIGPTGTTASSGVATLFRDRDDWNDLPLQACNLQAGKVDLHEPQGRLIRIDIT